MELQLVIGINQLSSSVLKLCFIIVCYYQLLYDNMTKHLSNSSELCIKGNFIYMKITAIYEQKQNIFLQLKYTEITYFN